MVGGEGDENNDVKTKEKWLENKIEKKMKLVVKKMKTKMNKGDGKNE